MPFSDESYSFTISSTKKVIKWIVITIETIEKEMWVNICSKVENIIKNLKKEESLNYIILKWKSGIEFIIRSIYPF